MRFLVTLALDAPDDADPRGQGRARGRVSTDDDGDSQMKKKRMIKLLMSLGCDRNDAARAATLADGNLPHTVVYYDLLEEFIRTYYEQLDKTVVEGDMTGAVSGMLGSHLYG